MFDSIIDLWTPFSCVVNSILGLIILIMLVVVLLIAIMGYFLFPRRRKAVTKNEFKENTKNELKKISLFTVFKISAKIFLTVLTIVFSLFLTNSLVQPFCDPAFLDYTVEPIKIFSVDLDQFYGHYKITYNIKLPLFKKSSSILLPFPKGLELMEQGEYNPYTEKPEIITDPESGEQFLLINISTNGFRTPQLNVKLNVRENLHFQFSDSTSPGRDYLWNSNVINELNNCFVKVYPIVPAGYGHELLYDRYYEYQYMYIENQCDVGVQNFYKEVGSLYNDGVICKGEAALVYDGDKVVIDLKSRESTTLLLVHKVNNPNIYNYTIVFDYERGSIYENCVFVSNKFSEIFPYALT